MRKRKSFRPVALCCLLLFVGIPFARAQQSGSSEARIVFRFVNGNDMFYIPWSDNGARLDSLCNQLAPATLKAGCVRVDGYGDDKKTVKIRCNRVKSELILRRGLTEEHFTTTNRIGMFGKLRNVVVVTLPVLEKRESRKKPVTVSPEPEKRVQLVAETRQEEPEGETPPTDVQTTTQDVQAQVQPETSAEPGHCRWSIGLNAGIPFFWGDMLSMSADKTYIGFAAGVQGGYRLSDLLAVSLSVD